MKVRPSFVLLLLLVCRINHKEITPLSFQPPIIKKLLTTAFGRVRERYVWITWGNDVLKADKFKYFMLSFHSRYHHVMMTQTLFMLERKLSQEFSLWLHLDSFNPSGWFHHTHSIKESINFLNNCHMSMTDMHSSVVKQNWSLSIKKDKKEDFSLGSSISFCKFMELRQQKGFKLNFEVHENRWQPQILISS